jgi:penicillin-binding protein 2
MKFNRIYEDYSLILKRAQTFRLVMVVLFALLVLYYWKVQILDHDKYRKQAEANRIRVVSIPAPRGAILDRNGVILSDNVASFKASIIRENTKNLNRSLKTVGELLDVPEDVLEKRLEKFASFPAFKPVVIKDNLTIEEVSRVEARRSEFPELIVEAEPKRYYPFGNLAAHAIGYLQELSAEELKAESGKGKGLGDLVGKTGLEREYQNVLVGTDGSLMEIVDNLGRRQNEYGRVDPIQGNALKTTLDFEIQMKARELLEGREGAVVVLDPRSGEILALASYPTFDPNKFISRFTPEEWLSLVNRADHPLENRAIRGLYSPGSIFKVAMAVAGLDSGVIEPETTQYCAGRAFFYNRPFHCWFEGGHGLVNLPNSIRYSCNVYFYHLAQKMGIDRISEYGEMLGYGQKTGVDLPGEKEGLVPSQEWSKTTRGTNWYAGETLSVGIGQGPLQTTPLQVAAHVALVANRGRKIRPHFLLPSVADAKVARLSGDAQSKERVRIPENVFNEVIEGMWRSVNQEGTGQGARIDGFDICGKTGSTQLISRESAEKLGISIKAHSWFSGFAPREKPQVVVTVLVEFGGMGGATAAPIARELFDVFRKKYAR